MSEEPPARLDPARLGPWAVIAGGSEGVGASFADQLADAGINLVLLARKQDALEATASAARLRGVEVRTISVDLTEPSAIEEIIAGTKDLQVGLLILNAGANSYGEGFLDGELAGFQGVIDLNITSSLALIHHFGGPMRLRGRGAILMVGSMAGYLGADRQSVYGASKAFLRIFAESLWLELRTSGVDVLELVLGVTRTPAMERAGLDFDIPGLNVAEPDEVAREGLAHLGDGPVWIAGGNAPAVEKRLGMDRSRLVLGTHRLMQRLLPPRP